MSLYKKTDSAAEANKFLNYGQQSATDIVFVDTDVEAVKVANRKKGIKGPGWYKVTEKTNADGSVTYKTEKLAAMAGKTSTVAVAGDTKGDDLIVGDVEISITAQPASISRTAPAAALFTVAGAGITTYQWQVQAPGGVYTNLTNTGVYTTVTTATMNISNSTGLNGNRYRCVCGNGGTAQVKSNGAKLTVV